MGKLFLYWNTVKYLKPFQVCCLVFNRLKKKKRVYFDKLPACYREVNIAIPELDCDDEFTSRFRIDWIKHGKVCLLNQVVDLDYHLFYTKELKPLISNNLYYFEYGVALGAKYQETKDDTYWELFKKCYDSYLEATAGIVSSYALSLHIPNVLIALQLFGDVVDVEYREKIYCELYSQYLYLQTHQEKHLLANHYLENIKALIITSFLFKDYKKLKGYLKDFKTQCDEQILGDGVHFELSLMYHKLILEDVMRIGMLTKQPGFPECGWVIPLINRMANAIFSLEKGIGRTPLFNDAGDNVAKTCDQLCLAAMKYFDIKVETIDSFDSSGYYKLYDGNMALIFDAGKIGVDYQPAHGHCDCLSFELSLNGIPLFVNSGTYEYQGEFRNYFRTTRAHNTVEINGLEQSQCWGGFRVAKRISRVRGSINKGALYGTYRNYSGEEHIRYVSLKNSILNVTDFVKAPKYTPIKSFLHISPDFVIDGGIIKKREGDAVCRVIPVNGDYKVVDNGELCYYAKSFGDLNNGCCLVFFWDADDKEHGYTIDFSI